MNSEIEANIAEVTRYITYQIDHMSNAALLVCLIVLVFGMSLIFQVLGTVVDGIGWAGEKIVLGIALVVLLVLGRRPWAETARWMAYLDWCERVGEPVVSLKTRPTTPDVVEDEL